MRRNIIKPPQPKTIQLQDFVRPAVSLSLVTKMKKIFDKFDLQKQGQVDLVQIQSMIRGLNLAQKSPKGSSIIMASIADGATYQKVDFQGFMSLFGMAPNQEIDPNDLFDLYDIKKTGYLGMQQFKAAAKRINISYKEKQLNAMIQAGDKDKDGYIGRDEFVKFIEKRRSHN